MFENVLQMFQCPKTVLEGPKTDLECPTTVLECPKTVLECLQWCVRTSYKNIEKMLKTFYNMLKKKCFITSLKMLKKVENVVPI